MSSDFLAFLTLSAVASLLLCGIITTAVNRRTIGNFASMTVYHDLQTKDKQEAVEIVIEKKAGKSFESQENGNRKITKAGLEYVDPESRTKNQEPRTKNQEPRTKNYEPKTLR